MYTPPVKSWKPVVPEVRLANRKEAAADGKTGDWD